MPKDRQFICPASEEPCRDGRCTKGRCVQEVQFEVVKDTGPLEPEVLTPQDMKALKLLEMYESAGVEIPLHLKMAAAKREVIAAREALGKAISESDRLGIRVAKLKGRLRKFD